jgi:hypothetical protein
LDSRIVIEQAKGILAERESITPTEAFDKMRREARSKRMKLHDLAAAIVDTMSSLAKQAVAELTGRPEQRTDSAVRARAEGVRDEPDWRGHLWVEQIERDGASCRRTSDSWTRPQFSAPTRPAAGALTAPEHQGEKPG